MKCPLCGIGHRTKRIAYKCKSQIDNEWGHYIILCHGMPGGVTEENLSVYKHLSISHFKEIKRKKEVMEKYFNDLRG